MQKRCIHQVSDLEKLLDCFPHTPLETHRCLYKISVASAVSSSALGFGRAIAGGNLVQEEQE